MNPEKLILLVEDEPAMALGITDALAFEGYRVVHAPTGRQGVELARSADPDLVLLDLMLPELSGVEVCRILRAEPATHQVRVHRPPMILI